jgi:hypothetical protein
MKERRFCAAKFAFAKLYADGPLCMESYEDDGSVHHEHNVKILRKIPKGL